MSTEKKQQAIALKYNSQENSAPVVTAKGQGDIAQKIIDIALENKVEIMQDSDLVEVLQKVDIGEQIPLEAFSAVAEILRYIYAQNAQSADKS